LAAGAGSNFQGEISTVKKGGTLNNHPCSAARRYDQVGRAIAAMAVLVLALTACGRSDASPEPSPTPTGLQVGGQFPANSVELDLSNDSSSLKATYKISIYPPMKLADNASKLTMPVQGQTEKRDIQPSFLCPTFSAAKDAVVPVIWSGIPGNKGAGVLDAPRVTIGAAEVNKPNSLRLNFPNIQIVGLVGNCQSSLDLENVGWTLRLDEAQGVPGGTYYEDSRLVILKDFYTPDHPNGDQGLIDKLNIALSPASFGEYAAGSHAYWVTKVQGSPKSGLRSLTDQPCEHTVLVPFNAGAATTGETVASKCDQLPLYR
jgi:hypothetical protein